MTLIVSLRIPDGIVIAGDSLSTLMGRIRLEKVIEITCPECDHEHEIESISQMPPSLATTFSYAQKVFPFFGRFGVGAFGAGLLANRSVYFSLRSLEKRLKEEKTSFDRVTEAAEKIGCEFHKLLQDQLKQEKTSVEALPENQAPLGFQVVGYDDTEPKTIEVSVGREVNCRPIKNLGVTVSGSQEIVRAIWDLYERNPQSRPPYPVFSLQDAIDYAEFLIRTTIDHQRFAKTIPTVGGDIDIALITPFDGFQWIRQKPLGKILEGK